MATHDRDWCINAWCRGKDPSRWDSDNRGGRQADDAKKACAPCPLAVRQQCAHYHTKDLKNRPPVGVVVCGIPVVGNSTSQEWRIQVGMLMQIAKGSEL
ncbi:WhiB family transcription factor [Gordonia Phage JonJames]|nr:WhiB family transcription factor [Gordonia Phage JonJames]